MPYRRVIFATAVLCVLCAGLLLTLVPRISASNSKALTSRESAKAEMAQVISLKKGIQFYRQATWRWQRAALLRPTRTEYLENRTTSRHLLRWIARLWIDRSQNAKQHAQNPPHLEMWLCIHSGEASWPDDDSPYWGGLQMGKWFHDTYVPPRLTKKGMANNWTPLEQIWVAERAFAREGYSPRWLLGQWPNTAPPCVSES